MEQKGYPPAYPNQPAYPGQLPPGQISPGVVVGPPPMFGKDPVQVTCGNCQKSIITTVIPENGACAYIAVIVVLLVCCPFFWVPLLMDACKDFTHTCPVCNAVLGRYKAV